MKREAAIIETTIDTVAGLVSSNVLSSLAQEKGLSFFIIFYSLTYLRCTRTGSRGVYSVSARAGGRSGGRAKDVGGEGSRSKTERGFQLSGQALNIYYSLLFIPMWMSETDIYFLPQFKCYFFIP